MHFSLRRTSKTRISGTATARAFIPPLAILLISQETSPPPPPPLKQLTGHWPEGPAAPAVLERLSLNAGLNARLNTGGPQTPGNGYGAVLYAAAGPWDPEADT